MSEQDTVAPPGPKEDEEEQFRAEQRAAAQAQNQNDPNAVPEQRPQAFAQNSSPTGELTQKLIDEGVIDNEPMGKEAYDRAGSESQAKKAAKNSKQEGILVGAFVKVTAEDSPHVGRVLAVTRIVEYRDRDDELTKAVGSPEQLYVLPQVIEGRARGDERDGETLILDVDEHGLEKVTDWRGTGRG